MVEAALDDFNDDDDEEEAVEEDEEAGGGNDEADDDGGEGLSAGFGIDSFVDAPADSFASLTLGEALPLPALESFGATVSESEPSSACCSKVLKQFLHSDFLHA